MAGWVNGRKAVVRGEKPTYHERNSNPHIDQTPWCVAAYNILQPEDPIKAGSFFRIAL